MHATSFRLPEATIQQIEDLSARRGTTHTQTVIVAIDRMAREETEEMFHHEINEADRASSKWSENYECFETADGRFWGYTDDPDREGVSYRDWRGNPIAVAVLFDCPGKPKNREI